MALSGMPLARPSFTVGIEEEYLLADRSSLDLAAAPEPLMRECEEALADQVSPEFLRCQIEVGTRVCPTLAEARSAEQIEQRDLSHHVQPVHVVGGHGRLAGALVDAVARGGIADVTGDQSAVAHEGAQQVGLAAAARPPQVDAVFARGEGG